MTEIIRVARSCELGGTTGLVFFSDSDMIRRYEGVRIDASDSRTFEHLEDVVAKAAAAKLLIPPKNYERRAHLLAWFDYMNGYAEGQSMFTIGKDFAPLSFSLFCRNPNFSFHGGLIYHGKGTQGMDVGSVLLTPAATDGWSMHT